MTVDIDAIYRFMAIISTLMSTGAVVFAWFAGRRKDVDRRLHEGSKRMDHQDLRIQALEQEVREMPDKSDLHGVELKLSEIAGDMKAMSASMRGMHESLQRTEGIVSRHEDHLRGNGT